MTTEPTLNQKIRSLKENFKSGYYKENSFISPVGRLMYSNITKCAEETMGDEYASAKIFKEKLETHKDDLTKLNKEKVGFGVDIYIEKNEETEKFFQEQIAILKNCMKLSGYPNWFSNDPISQKLDKKAYALMDGADSMREEDLSNFYVLKAKRKGPYKHILDKSTPFALFDKHANTIKPDAFYDGCYIRVKAYPQTWGVGSELGVKLYLTAIQFIEDGDRLSLETMDPYTKDLDEVAEDSEDSYMGALEADNE